MAEEHKCQSPPEGPRLCANNCGFFGSPATLGLCSKCYRDFRLKEEQASSAKMAVEMAVEKSFLSGNSTTTAPTPTPRPLSPSVALPPVVAAAAAAAAAIKPDADAPPAVTLEEAVPEAVAAVQEQHQLLLQPEAAVPAPAVAPDVAVVQQPPSQPPQPTRCSSCRKRVGLTGFRCRCGETFCGSHRYPEHHSCTFDFKSAGKDAIARANPVVKARKLDKI